MDWNEAIALLHGANWKHTKIGLERMRDFMHALGDPQEKLRYVHIAGTNGKGRPRASEPVSISRRTSTSLTSVSRSMGR